MAELPARAGLTTMQDYASKTVLQALGLNPQNLGRQDFSALSSGKKENFGQLLEKAVVGLPAFQKFAMDAPIVESVPANARLLRDGVDHGPLTFDEGQQFMVMHDPITNTYVPKGLFSGGFEPYQHGQALDDWHNALLEEGVDKVASTVRYDNGGARMSAHTFMPAFFGDFNLLEDTGEDILLGAGLRNGHDGSNALGFFIFGVRCICVNYSLRGVRKWEVAIGHKKGTMVRKWRDTLKNARESIRTLPDVINHAKSVEVAVKDVAPLLIGAGMPVPYIVGGKRGHVKTLPPMATNLSAYNPEVSPLAKTVSLWDVTNAGTALLTHAYAGAPAQAETLSRNLGVLLDVKSLDGLISAGQKTLADLEKKNAAENTA